MLLVRPHNRALDGYLRAQGGSGYGIATQIRLDFLKNDGYHVGDRFVSVIYKGYACALRGVPVPCPTPTGEFEPYHIRRRRDIEWPEIRSGMVSQMAGRVGNQPQVHGWKW